MQWLCHAPKVTTLRVNCLKTNQQSLRAHVERNIKEMTKTNSHLMPTISFHPQLPNVITISQVHAALDNILDVLKPEPNLKEVMVDVTCGAALLRGAHLYAPGVLAMPTQTQINDRVNIFADIEGLCKKGTNTVYESKSKVFIGIGVVQMQRCLDLKWFPGV